MSDEYPQRTVWLSIALYFGATNLAFAYTGPAAGLAILGAILGIIGAIFFGIAGFFWYPIKRWRQARRDRRKAKRKVPNESQTQES